MSRQSPQPLSGNWGNQIAHILAGKRKAARKHRQQRAEEARWRSLNGPTITCRPGDPNYPLPTVPKPVN